MYMYHVYVHVCSVNILSRSDLRAVHWRVRSEGLDIFHQIPAKTETTVYSRSHNMYMYMYMQMYIHIYLYLHCCKVHSYSLMWMALDEWGELASHQRSLTHHSQISRLRIQCLSLFNGHKSLRLNSSLSKPY